MNRIPEWVLREGKIRRGRKICRKNKENPEGSQSNTRKGTRRDEEVCSDLA